MVASRRLCPSTARALCRNSRSYETEESCFGLAVQEQGHQDHKGVTFSSDNGKTWSKIELLPRKEGLLEPTRRDSWNSTTVPWWDLGATGRSKGNVRPSG